MKKHGLSNTVHVLSLRARRRRTYYASFYVAGQHISLPIDAHDYRTAREEAESIIGDCGVIYSIIEV